MALFITLLVLQLKSSSDKSEALESCIENVQKKCGPVTSYAIQLERENSRLNKLLKKCRTLNQESHR